MSSALSPSARIIVLAYAGMVLQPAAIAQNTVQNASKTEAPQIGESGPTTDEAARRVFVDDAPAPRTRSSMMQSAGDQVGKADAGNTPPMQLTATSDSTQALQQLSKADLDATLAQLTPAEREVLLQAIEGTDICDNPPAVAAIVALCRTRLETRSGEFSVAPDRPLTAEETLLRGGIDNGGLPSVEAVIARLSRVTAASSDDFSNQAIASVALAPPPAPEGPGNGGDDTALGLGSETEALINAIVQQLGGQGGGQP